MQKDGFETISHDFRNILTNDYRREWRHLWRWNIYIKFVNITFSFRKHFGTVLTEKIRITKFCNEVFVMPKHLMAKLNIIYLNHPYTYLHSVQSFYPSNIAELMWYGKILGFFCTFTWHEALYSVIMILIFHFIELFVICLSVCLLSISTLCYTIRRRRRLHI